MFYLFGWGHTTEKDHGPVMPLKCPRCNNDTLFRYWSYRKWITLFFVPVIPYESKHLLLCDICTAGMELDSRQVERAEQLVGITADWMAKRISDNEYKAALDKRPLLDT